MTHSTYFIYGYRASDMVKDHSDSRRGNPLPPLHGLIFLFSSKVFFIITIPDRISYTAVFVTPVVEYWLERENVQRVDHKGSIQQDITP